VPDPNIDPPALSLEGFEHLAPRVQPTQKRARQTLERILETAARLIDEVGIEAFNTNLLAQRAGVRIRTVYRYFPNKTAVIAALMIRFHQQSDQAMGPIQDLGDPERDWRALINHWADALLTWAARTPGALLLTGDLQGIPELLALQEHLDTAIATELVRAMQARGLSIPEEELCVICRTFIDTADALTALAVAKRSDRSAEVAEELKLVLTSYLANYLD